MAVQRIALVEDDLTVLSILGDVLREAGYEAVPFRTSTEALSQLWDSPVDLLITDLILPYMTGLDLIRELRKRDWAREVPVLVISALSWPEQETAPLLSKNVKLLRKPFQAHDFLQTISAMLEAVTLRPPSIAPLADATIGAVNREDTYASLGERRRSDRAAVKVEVRLQTAHEVVLEYSKNLSHDGLFIRTYVPLPVQADVELSLSLPFRASEVVLRGQVVRSIKPESPEAMTHGPGMAIALHDVPKDLRHELYVFVTGVRLGATAHTGSPPQLVLLVGLEQNLPSTAGTLLRRAAVRTVTAATLPSAVIIAQAQQPDLVVANAELLRDAVSIVILGATCRGKLIAVGATPEQRRFFPPDIELIDGGVEPEVLLNKIADRLQVASRSHPRVNVSATVKVARSDGEAIGRLENVSLGGLLMIADLPCAAGELLEVDFELPGGASVRGQLLVVRVASPGDDSRAVRIAGIFTRFEAASFENLRKFLEPRIGVNPYLRYLGESAG